MEHVVFSIYDSKAEAYLPPFITPNIAVAVRMFSSAACDPTHNFAKFAGDYTLFEIGKFDDSKGEFISVRAHVNHGTALVHMQVGQGMSLVQGGESRTETIMEEHHRGSFQKEKSSE